MSEQSQSTIPSVASSLQRFAASDDGLQPSPVMIWTTHIFIFLVVLSGYVPYALQIAGLNLRPSQMFLPLVVVVLLKEGRREKPGREFKLFVAGSLLWCAFVFWTFANVWGSSSQVQAFGHVALTGLNLIQALLAYLLVSKTRRPQQAAAVFITSVALFNTILLLISVASDLGLASFGDFLTTEASPLLVESELTSGNTSRFVVGVLTGNISVAALLIGIALLLQPAGRHKASLWVVIVISIIGIIIGFSRQSLISAAAGLLIIALHVLMQKRVSKLVMLFVLLILVLFVVYFLSDVPIISGYFQAFAGRAVLLLNAEGYEGGTSADRIQMWTSMLSDFFRNPFVGSGQDAYLKYYPTATGTGSHSFPIEILHATGLAGFLPYIYLHLTVLLTGIRVITRRVATERELWLVAGLLAAFTAVLCASLTNLIFWSPQYWVILGTTVATLRLTRINRTVDAFRRNEPRARASSV
jgi:hypothetical protein